MRNIPYQTKADRAGVCSVLVLSNVFVVFLTTSPLVKYSFVRLVLIFSIRRNIPKLPVLTSLILNDSHMASRQGSSSVEPIIILRTCSAVEYLSLFVLWAEVLSS